MKKIRYILLINNDELYLCDTLKNKTFIKQFNSVKYDEIYDYEQFNKELFNFLKESKFSFSLLGHNLIFIKNKSHSIFMFNSYKEILINYFKKIIIKNISDVININRNNIILNITKNYIDFYYSSDGLKYLRINRDIFNDDVISIINHFIKNIAKPKKITIFGNDENIPSYANQINKKTNINTVFVEKYNEYLIEEIKNKM